jgi:L-ascorbate metabolism protein UlaG (beta-lactamase superfamily)
MALFTRRYHLGEETDHFQKGKFFNPEHPVKHSILDNIIWIFGTEHPKWPDFVEISSQDIPPQTVLGSELRASFVGHSTVLIQTCGLNILTDPVWSEYSGPSFFGIKRVIAPGISFDHLPKIDVIIISHNHHDHLDLPTIEKIWQRDRPQIIAPLGNDKNISRFHPKIKTDTLDWGMHLKINHSVTVHVEPCLHWSGRSPFEKDAALWGAFVLETAGGNIYFAGDTGYGKHFKVAKEKFLSFRLALLPIGAYSPRWLHQKIHLDIEEMICAHTDLGSPHTIPIHYGTFQLSDELYDEPIQELKKTLEIRQIDPKKISILGIGSFEMIPK